MMSKSILLQQLLVGEGFCYANMFQTKYRYDVVAVLGKLPFVSDLLDFVDSHGAWLALTSRFIITYSTSGMLHIKVSNTGVKLEAVITDLRVLETNYNYLVGAQGATRSMKEIMNNKLVMKEDSYENVQLLDDSAMEVYSSSDDVKYNIVQQVKRVNSVDSCKKYVTDVIKFFKSYDVAFESRCHYLGVTKYVVGFSPKESGHRSMLTFINYNGRTNKAGIDIIKFLSANSLNTRLRGLKQKFFRFPTVTHDRSDNLTIAFNRSKTIYRLTIDRGDDGYTMYEFNKSKFINKVVGYVAARLIINVYNYVNDKYERLDFTETCAYVRKFLIGRINAKTTFSFNYDTVTMDIHANYETNMTCFFLILVDKPTLDDETVAAIYRFYYPDKSYHIIKNNEY